MTSTRGRDTAPELAVRREAHRRGLRYRVDTAPLRAARRRADLVFSRARVAVFVDGCYWHGCPLHYQAPVTNSTYWREKIVTNRRRDRDTDTLLEAAGWMTIRVWEHDDIVTAVDRIEDAVRARTPPAA